MPLRAVVAVVLLCAASVATAAEPCKLALKVASSGFMLNPTVQSVTVASSTPRTPGAPCTLKAGDEILKINQQTVPGARATAVKAAWAAVKDGPPATLRIRRAGAVMTVAGR